mgnify:CR=1 FL=1
MNEAYANWKRLFEAQTRLSQEWVDNGRALRIATDEMAKHVADATPEMRAESTDLMVAAIKPLTELVSMVLKQSH